MLLASCGLTSADVVRCHAFKLSRQLTDSDSCICIQLTMTCAYMQEYEYIEIMKFTSGLGDSKAVTRCQWRPKNTQKRRS